LYWDSSALSTRTFVGDLHMQHEADTALG
jgi:hypothetical protein